MTAHCDVPQVFRYLSSRTHNRQARLLLVLLEAIGREKSKSPAWTSRIISSFALRSFHQSALALQNGVPYAPAQGHTREPAQQGCPAPRTSNDGRDARQLVLGPARDRHRQLPHVHASLAQRLVGPQCYRTAGSARHDPRVALPWLRYGYQHGQQDSGERPDEELPSVHTLQGWVARPSGSGILRAAANLLPGEEERSNEWPVLPD